MSLRKSLIGTVTILSLWGLSPGEEAHHKKAEEAGSSKPGHGMMEGCGMHGMMKMHDMMGGAMVATSDGGVVLRVGMTLYKFDKNLKQVKEVDVPVDMEKIHEKMKAMHEMKEKAEEDKKEDGKE